MTGPSIDPIAATGVLNIESSAHKAFLEDFDRQALDAEELREVEYEAMGIEPPERPPATRPTRLWERFQLWLSAR